MGNGHDSGLQVPPPPAPAPPTLASPALPLPPVASPPVPRLVPPVPPALAPPVFAPPLPPPPPAATPPVLAPLSFAPPMPRPLSSPPQDTADRSPLSITAAAASLTTKMPESRTAVPSWLSIARTHPKDCRNLKGTGVAPRRAARSPRQITSAVICGGDTVEKRRVPSMRAARATGRAPWSWHNFNRRALPHKGGTGAAKRRRGRGNTTSAPSS